MSQDGLSLSGLLPGSQSLDIYDDVKSLVDYMDGRNEQFMPTSENDVLINVLDDSSENNSFKQENEEPPPQVEETLLLTRSAAIPRVLSDEEYPGPFNFEVQLDPCGSKSPWVYSPLLRKIYIGINTAFPIDFKWIQVEKQLYVRATPTFTLSQHSQELVLRCMPHAQPTDASNIDIPSHVWDHIIRCNNMEAIYFGDKTKGVHLSVVVPLSKPQTGSETVREMFKFMCKNSCPSGMNRRPIQILFTIEDENFQIFGRRVLQVRICSCPKRDKEKEEKEYQKDANKNLLLNGKKRKAENNNRSSVDLQEYRLSCKIIGKNNYTKVLEYAADLMRSEAYLHDATSEPVFKRVLTEINNQLKSSEH